MTKSLRAEIAALANGGTHEDMETNGRLAIRALLATLDRADEVIEAARAATCCMSSECCGHEWDDSLENALTKWDELNANEDN